MEFTPHGGGPKKSDLELEGRSYVREIKEIADLVLITTPLGGGGQ